MASQDTIITIAQNKYYLIPGNETIVKSGKEIINQVADTFPPEMAIGAFCIGAVIGWSLFFINKKMEPGKINITDIGVIAGAIGNVALLSFFNNSHLLFGWYGIGIGVGFVLCAATISTLAIRSGIEGDKASIKLYDFLTGHK